MGYVSLERVTASVNSYLNPGDDTVAYRNVEVFTGVPVDMTTSISNQVADVGIVPHGFGVQMGGAAGYLATNGYAPAGFTPYTARRTGRSPASRGTSSR